jgi:hypothetical protein
MLIKVNIYLEKIIKTYGGGLIPCQTPKKIHTTYHLIPKKKEYD